MKVIILHLGNITQSIPATSIIKGIIKRCSSSHITWVVEDEKTKYIYNYNKNIDRVISFSQFLGEKRDYDLVINLFPIFDKFEAKSTGNDFAGFDFCEDFDNLSNIFFGGSQVYNFNIFQLYYKLGGLTWKGEGYDIGYIPRSRSKKNRVGISVANANLKNYVIDNLELKNTKIGYISYHKNIFKRMDEINKYGKIVTDDMLTFHLAMSLRKYVYFLKTYPLNLKIEFFGKGKLINAPLTVFQ